MLSADGLATANWPCPLAATCSVGLNRHLIQIVSPTPSGNGKLIAFLTPDFHAHFGLFGNQFTTPIVYDGEEKPMSMLGISETFVWSVWARIPCRLWDLGLNCAAHSRMTGKGVRRWETRFPIAQKAWIVCGALTRRRWCQNADFIQAIGPSDLMRMPAASELFYNIQYSARIEIQVRGVTLPKCLTERQRRKQTKIEIKKKKNTRWKPAISPRSRQAAEWLSVHLDTFLKCK